MIDQRAFDSVIQEMTDRPHPHDWRRLARMTIELYEAALWRPIEEAPRDGSTIQIQSEKLKRPFPLFANWEDADWEGPGFRVGSVLFPLGSAHLRGAMFRTIDPPKQNLTSDHEPKESDDAA